MKSSKIIVLLSLLLFLASLSFCAQEKLSKEENMAIDMNKESFNSVKKKAAFALGCELENIDLTIIQTLQESSGGEAIYSKLKGKAGEKES